MLGQTAVKFSCCGDVILLTEGPALRCGIKNGLFYTDSGFDLILHRIVSVLS